MIQSQERHMDFWIWNMASSELWGRLQDSESWRKEKDCLKKEYGSYILKMTSLIICLLLIYNINKILSMFQSVSNFLYWRLAWYFLRNSYCLKYCIFRCCIYCYSEYRTLYLLFHHEYRFLDSSILQNSSSWNRIYINEIPFSRILYPFL